MNSVDGVKANPFLETHRLETGNEPVYETEAERQKLDQEDFFSLLTQQLAYQDPFKPVENAEMVSQMTGFTTSEGIASLNTQMEGLNNIMGSNQALQASSLVGQQVLTGTNKLHNQDGQGGSGQVALKEPTKTVTVKISDQAGQLIKTIPLGDVTTGTISFEWDGTDSKGNPAANGTYSVEATGNQGGENVALPVANYGRVESVSLNSAGGRTQVNLTGLGSVNLTDVIEVTKG